MRNRLTVVFAIGATAMVAACDQAAEDRAAQQAANSVRQGNQALRTLSERVKDGSKDVATAAEAGAHDLADRLSDGAITARVKAALVADPSVDGLKIDVDTKAAVVTLSGTVPESAQSARAEDITRRVDGVRSVSNRLQAKAGPVVQPSSPPS